MLRKICIFATLLNITMGSIGSVGSGASKSTFTASPDKNKKSTMEFRKNPYKYGNKLFGIASPLQIIQKDTEYDLQIVNMGVQAGFSGNDNTTYGGTTSNQIGATSINLTFGYSITPILNFYANTYFNTTSIINPTPIVPTYVNAVTYSEVSLGQGFLTIGNLDYAPYYAYFGQVLLPYGRTYSAIQNSSDFTSKLFGVIQRAVGVGHMFRSNRGSINTEWFFFTSDTQPTNSASTPTTGVNIKGYADLSPSTNISISTGFMNNIADSSGFQTTTSSVSSSMQGFVNDYGYLDLTDSNNSVSTTLAAQGLYYNNFTGFATGSEFEEIYKKIAGVSCAFKMNTIAHITLSASYATALRPFYYQDLSFTNNAPFAGTNSAPQESDGARPSTANIYLQKMFLNKYSIYGGYEKSDQALALNIPKSRVMIGASIIINNFSQIIIEARRDTNYGTNCNAYGKYSTFVTSGLDPEGYSQVAAVGSKYLATPPEATSYLGQKATNVSLQYNVSF